ncbi:MAG TPA: hypothetical protein VM687_12570, partial [Stenotrophomonas sp.]|nr:hypothetical protein [Stenotrophomonas sp.]
MSGEHDDRLRSEPEERWPQMDIAAARPIAAASAWVIATCARLEDNVYVDHECTFAPAVPPDLLHRGGSDSPRA